jgi:hypothetical protein
LLTVTADWRDPQARGERVIQQSADHPPRSTAAASEEFRAGAAAATIGLWMHKPPYADGATLAVANDLASSLDTDIARSAELLTIVTKLRELEAAAKP